MPQNIPHSSPRPGHAVRARRNRLVREHLYGGPETLDAVELFHRIAKRHHPATEAGQIAQLALDRLTGIADAMRDGVRELAAAGEFDDPQEPISPSPGDTPVSPSHG